MCVGGVLMRVGSTGHPCRERGAGPSTQGASLPSSQALPTGKAYGQAPQVCVCVCVSVCVSASACSVDVDRDVSVA